LNYQIGFVVEETLGHKTFSNNLRTRVAQDPEITPTWMPIEFDNPAGRYPVVGRNYSFRASYHARKLATEAAREHPINAFFYHTQITTLFSNRLMRAIPSIISLDATPINYDSVGSGYNHASKPGSLGEKVKFAINQRAFRVCRRLVTWSQWAKDSLVNDYGIGDDKVQVLSPGVDLSLWAEVGVDRAEPGPRPKILFVGGDFKRKGGPLLLDVFRRHFRDSAELHLVTAEAIPPEPNVFVYNHFGSNAEGLRRLFHEADLFALPTLADVSSLASMEAMAARLPVVVSAVGGIPELVEEGRSGFLIPENDGEQLRQRLETLIHDPGRRRAMGERGRMIAVDRFDARKNGRAILDLLKRIARPTPGRA